MIAWLADSFVYSFVFPVSLQLFSQSPFHCSFIHFFIHASSNHQLTFFYSIIFSYTLYLPIHSSVSVFV